MFLLRLLLAAWLASAPLPGATQPAPESESQRLARELQQLIGAARCTADSQCRVVPVGAKACGGPASYWAWSTEGTDAARLADLAARQATAARSELVASGRRSNCAVVTAPAVACVALKCQVREAPAGPAS